MGLSYEDACRLGLAHEHPDHPSRRSAAIPAILPRDTNPPERTRLPAKNDKGQNKTEARFDAILADLAVKRLRAAGVRDDGFRAELVARCEAITATMDDLAQRATEHLRASRDIVPDATVSESSATRIARATQARSIPRKENA